MCMRIPCIVAYSITEGSVAFLSVQPFDRTPEIDPYSDIFTKLSCTDVKPAFRVKFMNGVTDAILLNTKATSSCIHCVERLSLRQLGSFYKRNWYVLRPINISSLVYTNFGFFVISGHFWTGNLEVQWSNLDRSYLGECTRALDVQVVSQHRNASWFCFVVYMCTVNSPAIRFVIRNTPSARNDRASSCLVLFSTALHNLISKIGHEPVCSIINHYSVHIGCATASGLAITWKSQKKPGQANDKREAPPLHKLIRC